MQKMMIALALLFAPACSTVGFVGSPQRTFSTNDSLVLSRAPRDFAALISEVARATNWDVSGINPQTRVVNLSDNSNMAAGVLIGRHRIATLTATLERDLRTVRLEIFVTGNFGAGGQAAVTGRLAAFKAALVARTQ